MELRSFGGGEDIGYNDTSFVEVSKIFVTQNTVFFGAEALTEPFDRVLHVCYSG